MNTFQQNFVKPFHEWNQEKQVIDRRKDKPFFPKVRHIYYAKVGVNIGFETDGKSEFIRPVLILSKIGSLYWVVPLTSNLKDNKFHHELESVRFENTKHSLVMLSQARVIDKRRFEGPLGFISKNELEEIQKKMKKLYFSSS